MRKIPIVLLLIICHPLIGQELSYKYLGDSADFFVYKIYSQDIDLSKAESCTFSDFKNEGYLYKYCDCSNSIDYYFKFLFFRRCRIRFSAKKALKSNCLGKDFWRKDGSNIILYIEKNFILRVRKKISVYYFKDKETYLSNPFFG